MKLEIILRTHDKTNVHTYEERFCGFDKKTLILGCLSSLVNSANKEKNHKINFKILDDHSSDDFKEEVQKIMNLSIWPHEFIELKEKGYNYSALKQFEYCRDSDADLVYSVEDDYLHYESAISELIENHILFTELSGKNVVLYPFDFPDDYRPVPAGPCLVVYGTKRHWRSGAWTTNTFLLKPEILQEYWHLFEKLATEYNPDYSDGTENHVHEGNTICKIWTSEHTIRMSPLPSLALHMQFERQKDPYIDWKYWWNEFTDIK
jgi:hypothetical protein